MNRIQSKFTAWLCSIGLFLNSVSVFANQSSLSYADIGNQLISAAGVVQEQRELTEEEKKKLEEVTLEAATLSETEKLKIIVSVLAQQEAIGTNHEKDFQGKALSNLVHDLELFFAFDDNNHGENIIAKIDNTQTTFGKLALAKMLASPSTDITMLRSRQAFIKLLVQDQGLFDNLDHRLKQVAAAESSICSCWLDVNKATQQTIDSLYFNKSLLKGLNNSPLALEAGTRLGNLGVAYQMVGDIVVYSLMWHLIGKKFPAFDSNKTFAQKFLTTAELFYWPVGTIKGIVDASNKLMPKTEEERLGMQIGLGFAGGFAGIQAIALGMKLYNIKQALTQANLVKNSINYLQTRLINVATLVTNAHQLQAIADAHDVINNGLITYPRMQKLFGSLHSSSGKFAQLIKLLETNTFKGNASFFSLSGRVLAAQELLKETKQELAGIMEFIGELDACLSVAKLYKKFVHERVHYTFVDYVASSNPYIKLEEFWNPAINPKMVVSNNIELGGQNGMRNIILTGSNTGGKSTSLKAVMLNILFAQTMGIAAANGAILAPGHYLATSLNIIDSTMQGKSLYQAEVDRITDIIKTARSMQRDGKLCYLALDEMFRGTRPEKADLETYECALQLAGLENISFILATHYLNAPLKLEKETDGVCKNYKVDAYVDSLGKIVHNYKILPGVTEHNIAGEILHNAFENDVKN